MNSNFRNRTIVTVIALTLVAAAFAATAAAFFSGVLKPNESTTHSYTVSRGWYTVDVEGDGDGDTDAFVYSEGGTLLGKDDLEDDNPIVEFFSTKSQTIRVKVKNTGRYTDAYDGEIYVSKDQG